MTGEVIVRSFLCKVTVILHCLSSTPQKIACEAMWGILGESEYFPFGIMTPSNRNIYILPIDFILAEYTSLVNKTIQFTIFSHSSKSRFKWQDRQICMHVPKVVKKLLCNAFFYVIYAVQCLNRRAVTHTLLLCVFKKKCLTKWIWQNQNITPNRPLRLSTMQR